LSTQNLGVEARLCRARAYEVVLVEESQLGGIQRRAAVCERI